MLSIDPREEHWTIFKFPSHCEVWLTMEWRNSTSRLEFNRAAQSMNMDTEAQFDALEQAILQIWQKRDGLKISKDIRYLIRNIARSDNPDWMEKFGLLPLYKEWDQYRKKNKMPPWFK